MQARLQRSLRHFAKRAKKYNHSSNWVNDPVLIKKIFRLARLDAQSYVLDIAIGTGMIAAEFAKKAKRVTGVDISLDMARQARQYADMVFLANAEKMPFKDNSFDVCVCRQGLQFMDLNKVIPETYRLLKPGGRVVFCHLTAYNEKDKNTAFAIQRLRNPARKNFFLPQDFSDILARNNFMGIELFEYISRESVNQWINNGAISRQAQEAIRNIYRKAPEDFIKMHKITYVGKDILDSMKLVIVRAKK